MVSPKDKHGKTRAVGTIIQVNEDDITGKTSKRVLCPNAGTTKNQQNRKREGTGQLISMYVYLSDPISGNLPCRYGETPVEMMKV